MYMVCAFCVLVRECLVPDGVYYRVFKLYIISYHHIILNFNWYLFL